MVRNNHKIYREIVLQLLGNKCGNCGNEENLAIHHTDGNFNNNELKNIELLCRKCHIRRHTQELNEFYNSNENNDKCKFIWECPICNKIIKSKVESESQFEYNKEQHIKSHKGDGKGS